MAQKKAAQMAPLSVRITVEMKARLEEIAAKMGITKHTLAQLAIEAAVEAAEEAGALVLPVKFEVTRVPIEKNSPKTSYRSSPESSGVELNEPKPKKKTG